MNNERDDSFDKKAETDISKAQSGQQPTTGNEDPTSASSTPSNNGQADYGSAGESAQAGFSQGDQVTAEDQRTDTEGSSMTSEEDSGFVGSRGQTDTSSELVDDQDFDKDGQGATE